MGFTVADNTNIFVSTPGRFTAILPLSEAQPLDYRSSQLASKQSQPNVHPSLQG